jgi:nitronate monooxygenase
MPSARCRPGVDGLILVCAGAGGHAGRLSPFALVPEVPPVLRRLHPALGRHRQRRLGAGRAGAGRRPRLSRHALHRRKEANATDANKQCIIDSSGEEIVYTNLFTGVHGNYLKKSIAAAGLDPDDLPDGRQEQDELQLGGNRRPRRGATSGARARASARSSMPRRRPRSSPA